jgi:AraC family transcriptional activator of pobA
MSKHPVYTIANFNQPVRKSELYVNTFKSHLEKYAFIEEPHRHNFYLLVLFTKGTGIHDIDFDRFEIKSGSLFLIQPGQIHSWKLSQDIEGYIVFYSSEIYNAYFGNKKIEEYPFYQSVSNNPQLQLSATETAELLPYFELMVAENKSSRNTDKLLNLLDSIHIEISRKYLSEHHHSAHSYNHKIGQFEKLLEHYFKTEKSPSFYASEMNMTLKHLNRICKNTLNETVTEIITKRIILEAKRLLTDRSKSVSQIADGLGYENYPYFGKLFKKHAGLSPGEFRNQLGIDNA